MLFVFEARRGRRGKGELGYSSWAGRAAKAVLTVRKGEERFIASLGMTTFTVRSLANLAVLELRIYDWSG
jgi:hypothetical protein